MKDIEEKIEGPFEINVAFLKKLTEEKTENLNKYKQFVKEKILKNKKNKNFNKYLLYLGGLFDDREILDILNKNKKLEEFNFKSIAIGLAFNKNFEKLEEKQNFFESVNLILNSNKIKFDFKKYVKNFKKEIENLDFNKIIKYIEDNSFKKFIEENEEYSTILITFAIEKILEINKRSYRKFQEQLIQEIIDMTNKFHDYIIFEKMLRAINVLFYFENKRNYFYNIISWLYEIFQYADHKKQKAELLSILINKLNKISKKDDVNKIFFILFLLNVHPEIIEEIDNVKDIFKKISKRFEEFIEEIEKDKNELENISKFVVKLEEIIDKFKNFLTNLINEYNGKKGDIEEYFKGIKKFWVKFMKDRREFSTKRFYDIKIKIEEREGQVLCCMNNANRIKRDLQSLKRTPLDSPFYITTLDKITNHFSEIHKNFSKFIPLYLKAKRYKKNYDETYIENLFQNIIIKIDTLKDKIYNFQETLANLDTQDNIQQPVAEEFKEYFINKYLKNYNIEKVLEIILRNDGKGKLFKFFYNMLTFPLLPFAMLIFYYLFGHKWINSFNVNKFALLIFIVLLPLITVLVLPIFLKNLKNRGQFYKLLMPSLLVILMATTVIYGLTEEFWDMMYRYDLSKGLISSFIFTVGSILIIWSLLIKTRNFKYKIKNTLRVLSLGLYYSFLITILIHLLWKETFLNRLENIYAKTFILQNLVFYSIHILFFSLFIYCLIERKV